jgi:hypothetical protein
MVTLRCMCTDERCGHAPGERCGKPIEESHAHPQGNQWICDDCWERIKPKESN